MRQKIGLLTIHGMGLQTPAFDSVLRQNLSQRLDDPVKNALHFQSVFYQDLIQPTETRVWQALERAVLSWRSLRKFALFYLGDVSAYLYKPEAPDSTYMLVHRRIETALSALQRELGGEDGPVVVIAHSLGCYILSNYIWDAQSTRQGRARGIWRDEIPTTFQSLGTCRLFLTSGCNIPLFVCGLDDIQAIDRPNQDFKWFNYYDKDDILGWPLKPLSSEGPNAYQTIVDEDIEINVGSKPWETMTPLSHSKYWEDKDFINPVARLITELYQSL